MREGWEIKKLGEVCKKTKNIDWTSVDSDFQYQYVDLSCVDRDSLNIEKSQFINKENAPSRAKQNIFTNDVLFATTRPTLKRVCLVNEKYNDSVCSTGFCVLRALEDIIFPKFIFYLLLSERFYDYIEPLQKGINYPAVSNSDVFNYNITIPSISEQTRIVEELDLLNGILDKKRQQLKELDALSQSIFYDMFGESVDNERNWDTDFLTNYTYKIGSGATPKGGDKSYKSEGISLIRSLNVHNNTFKIKDLAFIDEEQAELLKNVIVQENDVLLNITGASVARCCIVPDSILPARVNQHVSIIRTNQEKLNHIFLSYQFTSLPYQQKLKILSKGNGATREALTKSQLENLKIILPPIELQNEFADKIKSIERQKQLIKASIAETQTLLDSRMDYYFN